MNILYDTKAFGELHSAVVDMLTNRPDYKCTEEFASDLIYTISNASELLDTITRRSIALDKSKSQLRDFLSTNLLLGRTTGERHETRVLRGN